MEEIKHRRGQLYDSTLMIYKNSWHQSMEVEVKIEVTLGTADWKEHKEMFHNLDLATQVYT